MIKIIFFVVICLMSTVKVYADSVESLQTQRDTVKSVTDTSGFIGKGSEAFILNLPQIPVDMSKTTPGVVKTGTVYRLPSPITVSQLLWEPVDNGFAARIHLVSAQAKRLRFHLEFKQVVNGLTFRLQGNQNNSPLMSVDQSFIKDNNIWLPITIGNTADLEIFIKGKKPSDDLFLIDAVNIIVAEKPSGGRRKIIEKQSLGELLILKPQTVGLINEVEYDLSCWSNVGQYSALQIAANATALISFIKGGDSFVCSGTLLNDKRNSLKPWFITANHCITNQAVANSMSFEWFYRATSCSGFETDSRYTTTFGGARMLFFRQKK